MDGIVSILKLWAPFIILVGVMALLLRSNRRFYRQLNEQNQVIQRETARQLERIATALEKRP